MIRTRRLLVVGLLLGQAVLLITGAIQHSPVIDEPAHLAAGISNWELGCFDLFKVNPPLVRMLAALPVLTAGVKSDWSRYYVGVGARAEFDVMDDFVRANGERTIWLVMLARWALIPLMLVGGYVCYRWAKELYGAAAGIMALVLWCLCPNMLAYGQVINADAGATSLGVTAGYCFWKWLRDPVWDRALMAGIVLGLAELTKTTWVVLFGLWPALWMALRGSSCVVRAATKGKRAHHVERVDYGRQVVQLGVVLALAALCINAGYNFEGTATRLRDYLFVSRPLTGASEGQFLSFGNRFAKSWLRYIPVPLPRNYVEGIDLQWRDIEVGKPSYLRGCWQKRGWWYWYLYALTVKVPLGTWGLLLLATAVRAAGCWRLMRHGKIGDKASPPHPEGDGAQHVERGGYNSRIMWRDELVVLAPAVVVLALVSSQTGFSRYIRYVLPIFPFVFIWISSIAQTIEQKQKKLIVPVVALLTWSIASSLWYAPHWMSYFNELAGGPMGGPSHLIDAQVDWGQDLLYLKKWLHAHPDARPLKLVYFGPIDPRLAGIEFSLPPKAAPVPDDPAGIAELPSDLEPGWYAISANFLYGYPFYAPDGRGGRGHFERSAYNYLRRFRPVATAGYSVYIYHVMSDDEQWTR